MELNRRELYRFPWSKTDNPGGWVEVTDTCDMTCRGCYRHKLEGHRSLGDIQRDIDDTLRLTNCDCITIAGGEPLIYPEILEVVAYIRSLGIKPIIFSNGEKLTAELLAKLKKAGLAKMHLHIDSQQERNGWTGKNERELNQLRQSYADLLWANGRIQCGFHVTVFRSNLHEIPDVMKWAMGNLDKVQHVSFIAYRTIPHDGNLSFFAQGKKVDAGTFMTSIPADEESPITTEEMFAVANTAFPHLRPCAWLNGTTVYESYKFLIIVNLGTKKHLYGNMGKRTMEMVQMFYHLLFGRYFAFLERSKTGSKIFVLALFDPSIRRAFTGFLKTLLRNPLALFHRIYAQSIHFQQPNEVIDGKVNLCDDCVNMMAWKGKLINSCRLDEYRTFGEAMTIVKTD
jgi:pyruvate-formate lyase-activating enzyme